jgi:hypothetical protein
MTGMKARTGWPKTGREIGLLLQVLVVLTAVHLLLPCVKLRTLLQWLEAFPVRGRGDEGTLEKASRYTDALLWRIPTARPGPCLIRSLTLYHFARRWGLPVQVHCGARRVEGALQGHAWLSLNGAPFLESGDPEASYAVTFSYPAPASEPAKAEAA